jgi:rhodopsin domain-containing protein
MICIIRSIPSFLFSSFLAANPAIFPSHKPTRVNAMASLTPPNPLPPDENVNPTLLGISGTLIGFVVITSILRLWTRFRLRSLGWDDYTMAVVAVLAVTRFGVQCAQGTHGNGRHRWYLEKEDYITNNMLGVPLPPSSLLPYQAVSRVIRSLSLELVQ